MILILIKTFVAYGWRHSHPGRDHSHHHSFLYGFPITQLQFQSGFGPLTGTRIASLLLGRDHPSFSLTLTHNSSKKYHFIWCFYADGGEERCLNCPIGVHFDLCYITFMQALSSTFYSATFIRQLEVIVTVQMKILYTKIIQHSQGLQNKYF